MAWNKDTYYYQNQMKALSGSDPEKGYREDDPEVLEVEELEARIEDNGLYRFVSLIKDKFDKLKAAIRGAWRLHNEENEAEDLNECILVGNYKPKADTTVSNTPVSDGTKDFTLKVSQVGPDIENGPLWQDFILQESGHRWYRYGVWNSGSEKYDWGPWMLILTAKDDKPAPEGPYDPAANDGTADKIFLKRKEDWTIGSIGFGKDPAIGGTDYSIGENAIKAKIVLGEYTYGTELPSEHYARLDFKDEAIPKGQIYLQYSNDETEG